MSKDSLKILGLTYAIERVPFISRDEFLAGQIDHMNQKILIDEAVSSEREQVVLLHEMLHGIFNALGYFQLSNDETLVQSLAIALHQCLDDNPGMR